MGDVLSFFSGSSPKTQPNNFRVNSKTDFNKKTSVSDFRNRGADKIKVNGEEKKAKDIRDMVGNIILGGHQTARQIMRQLKDKYRVEIDDRRKIMRAVTEKYTIGSNDNRPDANKEFLKVNKILKDEDISSQTSKDIRDRIKHEREATGRSKTAENIEEFVKKMKRNINYNRSRDGQRETPLPSAAFALKQNRNSKDGSLERAKKTGDRVTNSNDIGVRQAGEGAIVSMHQYQQDKHYEKSPSALSHEKDATPVAGKVIPVVFSKGGDNSIKKAA